MDNGSFFFREKQLQKESPQESARVAVSFICSNHADFRGHRYQMSGIDCFLANNLLFKSVIYTFKPIRARMDCFFLNRLLYPKKGLVKEAISIFLLGEGVK